MRRLCRPPPPIRHVTVGRFGAAQFRPPSPLLKKGFLAWISLIWRVLATSTLRPFEGCGKTRFLGRKSVPRDLVIGFVPLRCLHPLLSLPLPDVFCFFCHSGASGSPYSVFCFFGWLRRRFCEYPYSWAPQESQGQLASSRTLSLCFVLFSFSGNLAGVSVILGRYSLLFLCAVCPCFPRVVS